MRNLVGVPVRLGRRRAHAELDRAFDQGEGLPLAVDEPAAVAPVLELGQLGIGGLELGLLVPLPQRPLGRAVDAGVGVVFVEVEQLGDQGSRSLARRRRGRRFPGRGSERGGSRSRGGRGWRPSLAGRVAMSGDRASPDRRPLAGSHRAARRAVDGVGDSSRSSSAATSLGIGAQRIQPVDDEAPQPGIGAVPQQRPDLVGLAHADQGDRRAGLRSASWSFACSLITGRCQTEAVTSGPSGEVRATESETMR